MSDTTKLAKHLKHDCACLPKQPSFACCLTLGDFYEAHGMGVFIEELAGFDDDYNDTTRTKEATAK